MKILTSAALLGMMAAAPALAQDKAAECARQADMVMQVVAARQNGAKADRAEQQVVGGLDDGSKPYATVVPAVVQWVYSLPADQLGDAVGDSWITACLAH